MNRYTLITILAMLVFLLALPIYAMREGARLAAAQANLRQRTLAEATAIYLENCATCHGTAGEGVGAMPRLNNTALAEADPAALFRTIARAAHGSAMSAWHLSEGGILNDYQINALVTLIQANAWQNVAAATAGRETLPAARLSEELLSSYLLTEGKSDPHACVSCHEEPAIHLGQFGLNCGRCHSPEAWKPALLVRHNFPLEHGGQEPAPCQTCHQGSYVNNTCYQCHDHQPEEMVGVHLSYNVLDLDNCVACHPTGAPKEAEELMRAANAQTMKLP